MTGGGRSQVPKQWLKRLLRGQAVRGASAWLLGLYLDLALRSTRWTLHGAMPDQGPAIVAFWHECLPLMPRLWLMAYRAGTFPHADVLISRHRDGQLIGAIMRRFHVRVVHGSSSQGRESRGGSASVRRLLSVLAGPGLVVITPDGPRGPRRVAAPGVAQLAALSGVAVVPAAAHTTRRRILRSWDRMILPLPFGRGVIVCGDPIPVPRRARDTALRQIEAALTEVTERAAALCAR